MRVDDEEFYERGGWSDRTVKWVLGGGVAFLLILFIVGAAVSDGSNGETAEPATVQQTEPAEDDTGPHALEELAAENACDHYHNARVDLGSGVLTTAEFRQKLQEVYRDAQLSGIDRLVTASRDLLAVVTERDTEGLEPAVDAMDDACDSL